MKSNRILVAVDSSKPSRSAAEAAWHIAEKTGCTVEAVMVINPETVWDFLGGREPGFVGLSKYLPAYERILDQMIRLADITAENYEAEAAKRGIAGKFHVIVGDPLDQLAKLSHNVVLVVSGHKPRPQPLQPAQSCFVKLSLAEQLAEHCAAPLLVVQRPPSSWRASTILMCAEHVNENYLSSVVTLSRLLSLDPEILCLCTGSNEEGWADLTKDLRKANPTLQDVTIGVTLGQSNSLWASNSYWSVPEDHPIHEESGTLIVVPTRKIEGRCITMFGNSSALWIHSVSHAPALLLFPEEFPAVREEEEVSKVSAL